MATKATSPPEAHTCAQCGGAFWARPPKRGKEPGVVCGRPVCWARQYWTAEEWEGRRRMALVLLEVLARSDPGAFYVDPERGPRWALPSWSELDDEAMRRGGAGNG